MNDEQRALVAEAMNRLPFVRWDRFVAAAHGAVVYGWIPRRGGRRDFVLLTYYDSWGWRPEDCSAVTSSARYSREIQRLLRGTDEGHIDCQLVEDGFAGLVTRIIGRSDLKIEMHPPEPEVRIVVVPDPRRPA